MNWSEFKEKIMGNPINPQQNPGSTPPAPGPQTPRQPGNPNPTTPANPITPTPGSQR